MGAELGGALLALAAVLAPLAVAWAVVEGPRWCSLWHRVRRRRHALARRDFRFALRVEKDSCR